MYYSTFTTSDNCPLAFQSSLPLPIAAAEGASAPKTCILLLHGFSGSSAYFARNAAALSSSPAAHWVVCPDMRGHGRSGHNPARGGYHVARLAADLRELLAHLRRQLPPAEAEAAAAAPAVRFVPVGCSIGAAVVWTYLELFGERDGGGGGGGGGEDLFAGFVFVDQAPLQDRAALGLGGAWGAEAAHRGCFDEASMLAAQRAWVEEPTRTHRALVRECLGYRFAPTQEEAADDEGEERARRDEDFFTGISAVCDGVWLARLLADHTRYDHREACEAIAKPVLVMAGRRSGCFPLEGMEETVRRARKGGNRDAEMMVFESGHWLFYEEPERFNRVLLKFVERCTS